MSGDSAAYNLPRIDEILFAALSPGQLGELSRRISRTHSLESVPAQIFSSKLAPAEAIVKYLKEEKGYTYHKIGFVLNRDERGIWGTYRRAKSKMPGRIVVNDDSIQVPLSKLSVRQNSIQEQVVVHLVDGLNIKFKDVATFLGKNYSTVHTTYSRAKAKATQTSPPTNG